MDFRFTFNKTPYLLMAFFSVLLNILAAALFVLDISKMALPLTVFFLIPGISSIKLLLKSPNFLLEDEAIVVSRRGDHNPLRLPLNSLTCISSTLLAHAKVKKRPVYISNGVDRITLPTWLSIDNRSILKILVERTTAAIEYRLKSRRGDFSEPGYYPPNALMQIIQGLFSRGKGENTFVFKGPVRKISPSLRVFQNIWAAFWIFFIGIAVVSSESMESFLIPVLVMSLFFGIVLLIVYLYSKKVGQKEKEWLLTSPEGIAMIGKRMSGELFWNEATSIKCLRRRPFAMIGAGSVRSASGLFLFISTRDKVYISIPDIYDVPISCLEKIFLRYAHPFGVEAHPVF